VVGGRPRNAVQGPADSRDPKALPYNFLFRKKQWLVLKFFTFGEYSTDPLGPCIFNIKLGRDLVTG